jgi:hypothetical protein
MIAEKFYIEKFLNRADADRLLDFSLGLHPVRAVILPWGNLARFVSLGSYTEFPSPHHIKRYGDGVRLSTAPKEVKQIAAVLTEFAKTPVNYISFNAYLNERDGMNFHQHNEDRDNPDQSVWVVSLGAARAVRFRPVGCLDKSKYETIYPAHGSLYILPSLYNTTHEHEVPSSKTPCGVRVGINCKHIEPPFVLSADDSPKVYDCHAGCKYPADAVYVGCKTVMYGKVLREGTIFGNAENPFDYTSHRRSPIAKTEAEFRAYALDKMKDPTFAAQVEALRAKDLLCWCKPGSPNCHARIWLELANGAA